MPVERFKGNLYESPRYRISVQNGCPHVDEITFGGIPFIYVLPKIFPSAHFGLFFIKIA
jgi:hypothetical protein